MKVLLYVWQFPQLLVALILTLFTKPLEVSPRNDLPIKYYKNPLGRFGLSLSYIIFIPEKDNLSDESYENLCRHEEGHTYQSQMLGIFYFLLIGLPSVILFWRRRHKNYSMEWYHSHYPEEWADKLGHAYAYAKLDIAEP